MPLSSIGFRSSVPMMDRQACPKPTPWEEGLKRHPSAFSFPPPASNPRAQHSSQLELSSHTPCPLQTLLSQPIQFVKTQTTSETLTRDQTVFGLGYFNKGMGRKRKLVSARDEAIKKMKRDSPTKNVDDQDLSADELLKQSQPVGKRRVVEEGLAEKTASEISAREIKRPFSGKSTIPPKGEKNEPNEELSNTAPTKPQASQGICTRLGPIFSKSGVYNRPYTESTALTPDRTTTPGMSPELGSTTKNQLKNPELNADSIAKTSEKTLVPEKSVLNGKPEALPKQPSSELRDGLRVRGLTNTSFFCYRNSVLQLLSSCTVFVEDITGHLKENNGCIENCVSCALGEFFQNHFRSAGIKNTPNKSLQAVRQLRNVLPSPFGTSTYGQEDASEYMLALLNKGIDQLNGAQQHTNSRENHFDRVFGAKYDSVLTCPVCENRSITPEYQLSLQLIPKTLSKALINLKQCLATNFSEEYVQASCENCGHKTEPSEKSKWFAKKTEIRKLPKFLVINISRYKMGGLFQNKIMNSVKLEEKLVLKEGDKDVTYQLRGMVSHTGARVRCGHYIAFIKQPDRTWAKCDDLSVNQSSMREMILKQNSFQIYMLGYEQVTC